MRGGNRNPTEEWARTVFANDPARQAIVDAQLGDSTGELPDRIAFEVPIKVMTEGNQREHWSATHRRRKSQERAVAARMPVFARPKLPVRVTLTRIAPRRLDPDGLPSSFKASVDAISRSYAVDDRHNCYSWVFRQEKGPPKTYAVRIEIESINPTGASK